MYVRVSVCMCACVCVCVCVCVLILNSFVHLCVGVCEWGGERERVRVCASHGRNPAHLEQSFISS